MWEKEVLRERAGEKRYVGTELDQSRDIPTEQRSNMIKKIEKTVKASKKGDNEKYEVNTKRQRAVTKQSLAASLCFTVQLVQGHL